MEPVSLVLRAAKPRSIMKGAVIYLRANAPDLWEGHGLEAQKLYVYSPSQLQNHLFFLTGLSPCGVTGVSDISKHSYGAVSQAWLPEGRLYVVILSLMLLYVEPLMPLFL